MPKVDSGSSVNFNVISLTLRKNSEKGFWSVLYNLTHPSFLLSKVTGKSESQRYDNDDDQDDDACRGDRVQKPLPPFQSNVYNEKY